MRWPTALGLEQQQDCSRPRAQARYVVRDFKTVLYDNTHPAVSSPAAVAGRSRAHTTITRLLVGAPLRSSLLATLAWNEAFFFEKTLRRSSELICLILFFSLSWRALRISSGRRNSGFTCRGLGAPLPPVAAPALPALPALRAGLLGASSPPSKSSAPPSSTPPASSELL